MKKIAMFNHKGGVSKTTTTFHLGWMLAEKGHRVVLVDTDPQCNLTGLILGTGFEEFYQRNPEQNIKYGLSPAFESKPQLIQAIECVNVSANGNLFLLPGHINLSEYEVTLGIAQELSGSLAALHNIPGAISYFINKVAEAHNADIVLIDMNPSLGAINQNLLMTSDFFIVPTAPDYFSQMAIESLQKVLLRWHSWAMKAQALSWLESSAYPFPKVSSKFIGTVIQKYRPRNGNPTEGFQTWIDRINKLVSEQLVPEIGKIDMTLSVSCYNEIDINYKNSYCISQIPDFNTLIATSQEFKIPVFALTDEMLGHVGKVLKQDQIKRKEFHQIFFEFADRLLVLIDETRS
jgi:cellulose biosynthesis protein BcsQ